MLRTFQKRHPPIGARPGTLVIPSVAPRPRITLVEYDVDHATAAPVTDVGTLRALLDGARTGVAWVDVQGLGDEQTLRAIGDIFGVHPLALEDVVNVPQRPKFEDYPGSQLLWLTRMVRFVDGEMIAEQVAMIVGPNYVLSFQETHGDVLDPIRVRVREGKGAIRTAGSSYLAYAILDTIVDAYYPVIEQLSAELEQLETSVVDDPAAWMVRDLNLIKAKLVVMRRGVWPQQEALTRLLRGDTKLVPDDVRLYLRDTHDHCTQLVDVIDSQRELVTSLMNTYLSLVANKTNDVMRLLTVVSSIFIPLTFVVGWYGMNFSRMPETHSAWGYPIVIGVSIGITVGMIGWFRRRGWLGGRPRDRDRDG
jgi:magnesium transporter